MKTLIVFNQPAPYKVNLFNELAKLEDIEVIFERKTCSNRNSKFYAENNYNFKHRFFEKGAIGEEGTNTNELVKILKKEKFDLIIMNGYSHLTEIKAIRYLNRHHIKWVLMINGGVIRKEFCLKSAFKKSLVKTAWKYISPCLEADKYLLKYGARKEDIYHYPYSTLFANEVLDKPLEKDDKNLLRQKYELHGEKIFVSPCQFIRRKNNMELIKIFENRPETLVLIGSGKEEQKYINYIKKHNICNIILRKYAAKDIIREYYQAADAFITLSKEDIYGHTTNEAMSQGIPVISHNNVISSTHLIKNGENGFLVDYHNIEQVNNAIDGINESMNIMALMTSKANTIEEEAKAIAKAIKELNK